MARPRRTKEQRERDRAFVAELYLKGETQAAIARALAARFYPGEPPLSQRQISYDIEALHKLWVKTQIHNVDQLKARELARIDKLERTYWAAWERSLLDAETVTEKGKGRGAGRTPVRPSQFEKTVQRRGQAGDPRFLQGVQWCIERRCAILGLEQKKIDLTSDGKPLASRRVYVEVERPGDGERRDQGS